ncbi:MAG: bifunctional precorrin-2 dehydrogenase/sirohydrochlorin ferrochelatase [Ferroplasma sp.]|uniref:precorrin-2 dehydrogenase/sirohydrochlorin ferrochelatase family protein n=1 Tax=Ferroplasma sp. TaxID=2591003 RepID=UPI002815A2A1|nr:bifunctional precorrin-2 dehydrogenase/sirohydrochlorin ferrochelatase [Ferroplasma sp.]WMT52142.1 MAG: bifunctional precorrin-2 dehydrogenase/sirohydrochlorin ferrochelatase [Ferroplasma sp.]
MIKDEEFINIPDKNNADSMIFNINLENKKILIAGGGRIAERKIKVLLSENTLIHVISPEVTEFIKKLSDNGIIRLTWRNIEASDINNSYFMVLCATDKRDVNDMISRICRDRNILHDNSGNHNNSDIMMVANTAIGDIIIAISTGGSSPRTSKMLKDLLIHDMKSSGYSFEDTIKAIYNDKMR